MSETIRFIFLEKLWKDRFCSLRKTRNKIMERKALGAEIIPRNFHYYDQLDFLPPPPRIKRIHFEVVGNSQSGVRQQAPENEMEHETTFEEKGNLSSFHLNLNNLDLNKYK